MGSLFRRHPVDDLARRQAYIEGYRFGPEFREQVRRQYENGLTDTELSVILEGLRSWFVAQDFRQGY